MDYSSPPYLRYNTASHAGPLSKRSQRVIINDVLSDAHDINAGVPQGSILGPILFLLFINNMPTILTQCSIEMYADDTLLYTYGKDVDIDKNMP